MGITSSYTTHGLLEKQTPFVGVKKRHVSILSLWCPTEGLNTWLHCETKDICFSNKIKLYKTVCFNCIHNGLSLFQKKSCVLYRSPGAHRKRNIGGDIRVACRLDESNNKLQYYSVRKPPGINHLKQPESGMILFKIILGKVQRWHMDDSSSASHPVVGSVLGVYNLPVLLPLFVCQSNVCVLTYC